MSRPRRILYIDLAPAVGGSVISLYQLVKGLDRQRYAPHVVLRAGNDYVARFRALDVPVTTLGEAPTGAVEAAGQSGEAWSGVRRGRLVHWLKRSALGEQAVHVVGFYLRIYPGLRREAHALAEIMRRVRPDLVHLNDEVCVCRSGIMAARQLKLPAICHLRSLAWRTHFDRWLSHSLRGYICISEAVERYQRTLGGRVAPSWVVYNGLDLAEFSEPVNVAEARAELGLPAEATVIGCLGRLVAWKGQRTFIQALAALPDRSQVYGVIVGTAEAGGEAYVAELKALIRQLGLEERVLLTGYRRDVPRLLRAMDLLVHASTSPEPFGRVLIESMAAGTVVIGTNAGAVPEIITDGVSGLLVPPGDAVALAQAIQRALSSPAARAGWQAAARRVVEDKFTTERYVAGVERVYEGILIDSSTA